MNDQPDPDPRTTEPETPTPTAVERWRPAAGHAAQRRGRRRHNPGGRRHGSQVTALPGRLTTRHQGAS